MTPCATSSTSPTWSGTPRWCGSGRSPPGIARPGAGQGRVLQPRRQRQGPHRAAHGRGRRGLAASCGPAARSSSRRRGNTGVGLAIVAQRKGYRCVFVCPDKVGEDKRNVLRAYGAEVVVCPTAVDPDHPDSYYRTSDRLVERDRRRLEARTSTRTRRTRSRTTCGTGPGDVGADRGADHALRRGHRHRRHDHRHGPLPQGGVRRPGPGDRRGPGGLGVLGRHRAALPRRGRGRGLLAHHLRQGHLRPDHRGLRRRLVRHDAAAGARGGAARRRVLRDGDGGRAAGRGRARPDEAATPWSSCCCPTAAAATWARSSTTRGWPATGSCRPPRARRSATCCAARTARSRRSCTPTRTRPSPTPSHYLREFAVSQMPVVRAEPPVMAAEVAGSVVERDLLDALFTGRAQLSDRLERHMSPPLPTLGANEPLDTAMSAFAGGRRRAGAGRRQARGRGDPLGRARVPRRP